MQTTWECPLKSSVSISLLPHDGQVVGGGIVWPVDGICRWKQILNQVIIQCTCKWHRSFMRLISISSTNIHIMEKMCVLAVLWLKKLPKTVQSCCISYLEVFTLCTVCYLQVELWSGEWIHCLNSLACSTHMLCVETFGRTIEAVSNSICTKCAHIWARDQGSPRKWRNRAKGEL